MKKIFGIIWKIVRRFLIFFFTFVICWLLVAWVTSNIATSPEDFGEKKYLDVYAGTNGVHSDVILPVGELRPDIRKNLNLPEYTNFVAFGWGDKGFYLDTPTWGDLTAKTAINAAFLPSDTAMHVTWYKNQQENWKRVIVGNKQIKRLQDFIDVSFEKVNNKYQIIPGHSYGKNDAFYEAVGSYTCFKTCNTWTNNALKAAEIKTAIWTPYDTGVLKHLEE